LSGIAPHQTTVSGQKVSELADLLDVTGSGVQVKLLEGTVCLLVDSLLVNAPHAVLTPADAEEVAGLLLRRAREARGPW